MFPLLCSNRDIIDVTTSERPDPAHSSDGEGRRPLVIKDAAKEGSSPVFSLQVS